MNKVIQWVAGFTLGRYLVAPVAWLHDKLDGRRSEIILGLVTAFQVLKYAGILTPEQVAAVDAILLPLLPLTMADKVSKAVKAADKVVPKLPEAKP